MNTDEANTLLMHLTNLDSRLGNPDEDQWTVKCASWALVLTDVPLRDAMALGTELYGALRIHPVQPGELLEGWKQLVERRKHTRADRYPWRRRDDEGVSEHKRRCGSIVADYERDEQTRWAVHRARDVLRPDEAAYPPRLLHEVITTLADPDLRAWYGPGREGAANG